MIAGAATYPDWVIRARKELDSVCRKNAERLPQWSDQEKLPYITAVVKESFRYPPETVVLEIWFVGYLSVGGLSCVLMDTYLPEGS